jgi:hypothetical protein
MDLDASCGKYSSFVNIYMEENSFSETEWKKLIIDAFATFNSLVTSQQGVISMDFDENNINPSLEKDRYPAEEEENEPIREATMPEETEKTTNAGLIIGIAVASLTVIFLSFFMLRRRFVRKSKTLPQEGHSAKSDPYTGCIEHTMENTPSVIQKVSVATTMHPNPYEDGVTSTMNKQLSAAPESSASTQSLPVPCTTISIMNVTKNEQPAAEEDVVSVTKHPGPSSNNNDVVMEKRKPVANIFVPLISHQDPNIIDLDQRMKKQLPVEEGSISTTKHPVPMIDNGDPLMEKKPSALEDIVGEGSFSTTQYPGQCNTISDNGDQALEKMFSFVVFEKTEASVFEKEHADLYSKPIELPSSLPSLLPSSPSSSNESIYSTASPVALPSENQEAAANPWSSEEALFWLNHPRDDDQPFDISNIHECSAATCRICEIRRQQGMRKKGQKTILSRKLSKHEINESAKQRPSLYEMSLRRQFAEDTVEL